MNIRKHWKKILLASTALFWANCGDDSSSAASPDESGSISSDAVIPESSSANIDAPESSANMEVPESSSIGTLEACSDTVKYPLVVDGTNIRCAGDSTNASFQKWGAKVSERYSCCDGSVIEAPKYVSTSCSYSLFSEKSDSIPDDVHAYWANDTLYTRQGRIDRNNRILEENAKNSKAYEDSVINEMNLTGTYCKDHGGIVSRKDFSAYDFSETSCENLTRTASEELRDTVVNDTTLSDEVRKCVEKEVSDFFCMLDCCVCVYGPSGKIDDTGYRICEDFRITYGRADIAESNISKKGETASVECKDGTTEYSDEYKEQQAKYDKYLEESAECHNPREEVVEIVDKCKNDSVEQ